ncbi:MAG: transglutaminase-like cysteine peptidase [Variibacter sp.]|nr:transglutaminase-like cysteine peptidase [Variibacter sp.]
MNMVSHALFGVICLLVLGAIAPAQASDQRPLFIATAGATRAPIGWVEFCAENAGECAVRSAPARDAGLNGRTWKELNRINALVNASIKPMTDQDHYGVLEKWSFPDDGYGDCEDYVLLKQRMLVSAGWPRQALLVTVVRDQKGDGHAVLTVRTDKGEFILDNQNSEILLWSETNYRYVKRQSQSNPNEWVSLGDPRPAHATASSR